MDLIERPKEYKVTFDFPTPPEISPPYIEVDRVDFQVCFVLARCCPACSQALLFAFSLWGESVLCWPSCASLHAWCGVTLHHEGIWDYLLNRLILRPMLACDSVGTGQASALPEPGLRRGSGHARVCRRPQRQWQVHCHQNPLWSARAHKG